ncbi:MAG: hypothetical protein K6B46_00095 [Opitutales bacterium]|nr:hypothetical protein [Opitutales bacterium]
MKSFYSALLLYFSFVFSFASEDDFTCTFSDKGGLDDFLCGEDGLSNTEGEFTTLLVKNPILGKEVASDGIYLILDAKGFFLKVLGRWSDILNEGPAYNEKEEDWNTEIKIPIPGRNGKRHLSGREDSFCKQYTLSLSSPSVCEMDKVFIDYIREFNKLCLKEDFDNFEKVFSSNRNGVFCQEKGRKFLFWRSIKNGVTVVYSKEEKKTRVFIIFREKNNANFIAWEIIKKENEFFYYEYVSDEQTFWLDFDGDGMYDKAARYDEFGELVFYELKKELIQSVEILDDEADE